MTLYYQLSGDEYAKTVFRRVGDFYLHYINDRFEVVQGTRLSSPNGQRRAARSVGSSIISWLPAPRMTQKKDERLCHGNRRGIERVRADSVSRCCDGI